MYDLVCFSHLRWDFVWQRPQHLLSRLAKHYRIVFVEEPIADTHETTARLSVTTRLLSNGAQIDVVQLIYPSSEARWIGHGDEETQPVYESLLNDYLKENHFLRPILWFYTPMAYDFATSTPHQGIVVDVMDQLSAFKGAPKLLIQRENQLLPMADIVFTGGMSLYEDKKRFNLATFPFPSGVEIEHFAPAAVRHLFAAPSPIDQLTRPILGYYGVIDERMDFELLAEAARMRPDWNIVLIGPVVKIEPKDLPQLPNMHYPGMKSYNELPTYLAHFDVALIPFALCEATRYLSPTKTLEYMAAHKPIVSTPIHDVVALYEDVVRIAHSPDWFIAHVEAALAEDGAKRLRREREILQQHSWDSIAERMRGILNTHIHPARQRPAARAAVSRVSSGAD